VLVNGGIRTAALVLGALGVLSGAAGFAVSAGQPFTAAEGARVGELFHLNPLGSLVTLVLGLVALGGAVARVRAVVLAAAAGWLLAALQVVLQSGGQSNLLGGTASTLALFLAMGGGLLALAVAPDEVAPATVDT